MKKIFGYVKYTYILLLLILCFASQIYAAECGDVNSDEEIDIVDALLIAQYYVNLNPANFDSSVADVNGDGEIDIVDALLVAQLYVGLIPTLDGCLTPTPIDITPPPCVEKIFELQAETEATWSDGIVDTKHAGYTGSGFVDTVNAIDAWIEWGIDIELATNALCVFSYACASEARSMDVSVNGSIVASKIFPASGTWTTWSTEEAIVSLNTGSNTIRLTATTSGGAPNIDKMDITICGDFVTPTPTPTSTPTPTPTPDPTFTPPGWTPPPGPTIGLYRTFERSLTNDKNYSNKFADVELQVTYRSPSGKTIDFFGFFDGDGAGGGNKSTGNVWKMRFMPDELGTWNYTWSWSDDTAGGEDVFITVPEGAGKGILGAYKDNPRWMAYNGTEPVFIKSYYESGHGAIAQPFDWIKTYVYQPMLDRGYNHLQVNWLLPLCCEAQYYHDGPPQSISSIRLYDNGKASSTMRFNVWYMMEEHVQWLNDRNVGLHMFLGFNGGRNGGPDWKDLSSGEQDFYVKYVVARLAPYACIAGWNYVWEVSGSDAGGELGLARLLEKYDIFEHLRTYEDAHPEDHEWDRPEYTFAATENHGVSEIEAHKEGWSHHVACLVSYVPGKPVYMSEGNGLWRRYWQARTGATQDNLRQSAWGCTTAGASFCWNGHKSENNLEAFGPDGLPFNNPENKYTMSEDHIEILTRCMNDEVVFYRMTPQDSLLSGHDSKAVWCLAETGQQYLVFALGGKNFNLNVASGQYNDNIWLDAKTGSTQSAGSVVGGGSMSFTPPNTSTDWVLILRR